MIPPGLFLADTSAIARATSPAVLDELGRLGRLGLLATIDLEVLYSARTPAGYRSIAALCTEGFTDLALTPEIGDRARAVQLQLSKTSQHRSAGVVDLLTAATAEHFGATVLPYDADFDQIALVTRQTTPLGRTPRVGELRAPVPVRRRHGQRSVAETGYRRRVRPSSFRPTPRVTVAAILGAAGVAHFAFPAEFDRIVPTWMPGSARTTTYTSGVVELAVAVFLASKSRPKLAGYLALATFIGVFPANLQSALDGGIKGAPAPLDSALAAWLRLPLQIPLLWLAWRIIKDAA